MRVMYKKGILVQDGTHKLYLDPERRIIGDAFISHAHSDHLCSASRTIVTEPTSILFPRNPFVLEYEEPVSFGDMSVTLYDANHVLGSAQILIENGARLVYTGDIRLRETPFFGSPKILKTDILIIESTYGLPKYTFPSFSELEREILSWVDSEVSKGNGVIFGSYVLGKAQEVVYILNKGGYVPVVHPDIARICELYKKYGYKLRYISSRNPESQEVLKDCFVIVFPIRLVKPRFVKTLSEIYKRQIKTAYTTGWGRRFYKWVDRVFLLSDHAGFPELVEYVKKADPEVVYTVHGYTKELARSLCEHGFNAIPLE